MSASSARPTSLEDLERADEERFGYEPDAPSEPDWESIQADRDEDRREYEEDRAQDRYDRSVYGP